MTAMLPLGYSVRELTPEDLSEITNVESRNHVAPWSRDNFAQELNKPYSKTLVVTDDETDEKIISYATFWILFGETQLLNIVTDIAFRGQGIAQELMQHMIRESIEKDSSKIILDVRVSNQSAIALYQNQGFVISSRRKNFYSDGEDAYQMAKFLKADPLSDF